MSEIIGGLILAGIVMAIEYWLCTKFRSPLWGGIIPAIVLLGTIYLFTQYDILLERRNAFPFILINIMILGDWITGREKYKKLQEVELNKMKAKDIS